MLKSMIAAVAALAIAGTTFVYAQQGPGRGQPNPDRFAKTANARLATIKAALELTPDQAQKWGAYQQAVENVIQLRVQAMQARAAHQSQAGGQPAHRGSGDPFARLSRRIDGMTKTSAALKQVADAGEPLYSSLSDAQKGRFKALTRLLEPKLLMMGRRGQHQGQGRRQHG
jgi:hypothetical protein